MRMRYIRLLRLWRSIQNHLQELAMEPKPSSGLTPQIPRTQNRITPQEVRTPTKFDLLSEAPTTEPVLQEQEPPSAPESLINPNTGSIDELRHHLSGLNGIKKPLRKSSTTGNEL